MHVSVILATYNQPRWLEKSLWGFATQRHRDFDIVLADDGSGPETAEVVSRMRADTGLAITHVWHEDRGFRKTEILNRAILATSSEYLIFSDGDCIPRDDFVATHVRLARPGRYLSGGYLKLPPETSEAITPDDIRTGRFATLGWLRAHGYRPGYRFIRLMRSSALPAIMDRATSRRSAWRGNNSSTWREAIVAVNGFDNDMAYGSEDRALGERLMNAGIQPIKIRHRAPTLHLDHGRPWQDPVIGRLNYDRCVAIRRDGTVRAPDGLAELAPAPSLP